MGACILHCGIFIVVIWSRSIVIIFHYFISSFRKYCWRVVRTHLQYFIRMCHSRGAWASFRLSESDFRHVSWCANMFYFSQCGTCLVMADKALVDKFKFFSPFLSPTAQKYTSVLMVCESFSLVHGLLISLLLLFFSI